MNLIEFSREDEFSTFYPTHPLLKQYVLEIDKVIGGDYNTKYKAFIRFNMKPHFEFFETFDDAREFCTNVLLDEIDSKEKLYQEIKQILNPKKRYTLEDLRLLYLEYESTSKVKYFTEWLEEKEK